MSKNKIQLQIPNEKRVCARQGPAANAAMASLASLERLPLSSPQGDSTEATTPLSLGSLGTNQEEKGVGSDMATELLPGRE